jgi:hypothetical protein
MHEARQVLISNPFRRGIHHYPSSSGRRGMNLKSLQGQVEQLVLNLPLFSYLLWFLNKWPQKHFESEPTLKQSSFALWLIHVT